MPNVGLIVSQPKITLADQAYGRDGWRLSFDGELANSFRQRVELTSEGRTFTELVGTVAFEDADETEPHYGFSKGSFSYWEGSDDVIFPQPASWLATIRLPSSDLKRLVKTLANGLPLMSLNIDVEGMEYGWEPDGSGKKWDNVAKPALEIAGYRLFFGVPEEDEIVPDPPEPAVDTEVKSLGAIRELNRTVSHVLYAIIALAVIILVRG